MKNQVSKETLFNYFAGGATALQKQLIDEWAKDETNREQFFECLAMWENQDPQFIADANMALMRHQQRIKNYTIDETNQPELGAAEPALHSLKSTWFRWMMAASVGIILLLSGLFFKEELLFKTYSTEFGETSTIMLNDGSQVTLNANSTLRVPRFGFGQKTREVVLVGEADFSIKHMPDHQHFVVQTNKNFEVVVLGTEFLVNTRETGKKVVLNKGKVRLLYQEGKTSKQLTMKPGNLVTFDNEGHVRIKQTPKPRILQPGKNTDLCLMEQPWLKSATYLRKIME
ncbi:FecR family protein [Spirosoma telluris]|uniref:FecR family protein n=1 Tax=Spirosoma telluris TaxID=2183553 RepID=UPI002FC2AEFE